MKEYLVLCLLLLVVNINAQELKEWNVDWGEANIAKTEFSLGKSVDYP